MITNLAANIFPVANIYNSFSIWSRARKNRAPAKLQKNDEELMDEDLMIETIGVGWRFTNLSTLLLRRGPRRKLRWINGWLPAERRL
jgi:hypothetical protein